jgi:sugar phosphate isomerase/epimerase
MDRIALGIVSDEVTPDFEEAVRHALPWGISIFELRVLKSGRIPAVEPMELRSIQTLVKNNGISISALSPGIFKSPLSETAKLEDELTSVLPRTLEMAQEFEASIVIVFGFQRSQAESASNFGRAAELMRRAAEKAQKLGVTLAIENEPGFWCDSGSNTAKLISAVDSPSLRANWDPCNGYGTAEVPYPDGYEAVKQYIANVHVKDTKEGSLIRCVAVGEGAIDWKGQIKAIVRERLVKHITIETHCLPLIEKSKQNVDTLNRYLTELYTGQGVRP